MPVPKRVVRMVQAILVCGALVVVGACGLANGDDGPTAAEAGTQLAKDARSLLDQVQDIHNLPEPYTVTEDATKDVPCGKGKAKRTFAAKTRIPVGAGLDNRLDRETTFAIGALTPTYRIEHRPGSDELSSRRLVMRNDDRDLLIAILLTPHGNEVDYSVNGETSCLRATP